MHKMRIHHAASYTDIILQKGLVQNGRYNKMTAFAIMLRSSLYK